MRTWCNAAVMAVLALPVSGGLVKADLCEGPLPDGIPMDQLFIQDGVDLRFGMTVPGAEGLPAAIQAKEGAARDLAWLEMLWVSMAEPVDLSTAPHAWPTPAWQAVREVLAQRELDAHLAALDALTTALPWWDQGPEARTARLVAEVNAATPLSEQVKADYLDAVAQFTSAAPDLVTVMEGIVAQDADLQAAFAARRQGASDADYLMWLQTELMTCLDAPEAWAEDGGINWAVIDPLRAAIVQAGFLDYLSLDFAPYMALDTLGGPVGAEMPELASALEFIGRPEDAGHLRAAMALIAHPWIAEDAARAERIAMLSQVQRDQVLETLLRIDTAAVKAAQIATVRDAR